MEVYVHNNPGNIVFNAYVLLFVRSWNMPWNPEKDVPPEDTWLRVPAFRSPGPNGADHYVTVNAHIENASPVLIAEEECTMLRIGQAKSRKPVPKGMILSILDEAIDISAWEKEHQKSWPYREMFDDQLVMMRHAAKLGPASASGVSVTPTNPNLNLIRKSLAPRPCRRCGKNRVRAR